MGSEFHAEGILKTAFIDGLGMVECEGVLKCKSELGRWHLYEYPMEHSRLHEKF